MKKNGTHNRTKTDPLITEYVESLRRLNYSKASLKAKNNGLTNFSRYLEFKGIKHFCDVTEQDITSYRLQLLDRDYTPHTVQQYLNVVRAFFLWLEEEQQLFINPAANIKIKRPSIIQPIPTEQEVMQLIKSIDVSTVQGIRDRAIIEILYGTGIRAFEMMSLTVFDPDIKNKTLRVKGKGKKERLVPIGSQAIKWLQLYLKHSRPKLYGSKIDHESLWLSQRSGIALDVPGMRLMIRKRSRETGIKTQITPHALRRACATHMLNHGAHPVQIQLLLGHADLSTLSQYLQVSITDMKKAHKKSKPGH